MCTCIEISPPILCPFNTILQIYAAYVDMYVFKGNRKMRFCWNIFIWNETFWDNSSKLLT